MTTNEKRELKYETKEGRSIVGKDYETPRTALEGIRDQDLIGTVVKIVSANHIIVAEQECEFYLSNITFPKFGGDGVELEAYADEAKDFLRAHLIGRQVHVQLEYSRKPGYGSVFIGYALDSQNVSELVVSEGLDTALRHNDIIDLSNATRDEAGEASDYIFVWAFYKYEKVQGVVESVISANNTSGYKIILQIQRIEKTWKIAFALDGVTCPRGNETYADEAIQLLREAIVQRTVEVELRNIDPIDMDGYFVGTLLESNTHVAIPLLQAGIAKLGEVYRLAYSNQLTNAQEPAKTKKLNKTWKIPFSLSGVIWPRGKEPDADEAFELLRQSIVVDKRVEVLLEKFDSDSDGYFVGTLLLESNTHVAIPLVKSGLAKLEGPYPKGYRNQIKQVQISAQMKRLKWPRLCILSWPVESLDPILRQKRGELHS
ncbi:hypothetical protein ACE6H2_024986 [Prunus campanulata]